MLIFSAYGKALKSVKDTMRVYRKAVQWLIRSEIHLMFVTDEGL